MPVRLLGAVLAFAVCGCGSARLPASVDPDAGTSTAKAWVNAVINGDTEAAVYAVQSFYEASDAGFPDNFTWDLKPYDEPLNYYSTATRTVVLGRMPTAAETSAYWSGYRDRLTGDAWDPDAFFRDDDEARTLAAFNQAYLAAHEAGHALAYFYAVNPVWNGTSVHCQELFADRLAAAFLADVAAADPRADSLRRRYGELLDALDAAIPAKQRVALNNLETCADVAVEPPSDAVTFRRYVSAFAARQRLLLATPSQLSDVVQEHVTWRRSEFVASVPDVGGTEVSTLSLQEIPGTSSWRGNFGGTFEFGRDILLMEPFDVYDTIEDTGTAYALHVDGRVSVVESESTARLDTLRASPPYGRGDFVAETGFRVNGALVAMPDLGVATIVGVQSAAALDEGDILALLVSLDARADDAESGRVLRLARFQKGPAGWRVEIGPPFPRNADAEQGDSAVEDVMIAPGGALVESAGQLFAIDLATLRATGAGQPIDFSRGDLLAIDAEGRHISVQHDVIGVMKPYGGAMYRSSGGGLIVRSDDRGAAALAGSGLQGHRDSSNGALARFGTIYAARAVDGALFVVDGVRDDPETDPPPRVRRVVSR